jgi:phage-related holin
MLIDVCTTFRVDWYVFPLSCRQFNGHHRIVVIVVVIVVAPEVRAVLKIMGHQRLNNTY